MRQQFQQAFLAVVLSAASPVHAHEYWLEPRSYSIEPGEALEGNLKNGQNFKGSRYSYIDNNIDFFKLTGPSGTVDVTGRNGDVPALNVVVEEAGLHIASYQGNFDRITFTNPDKIKEYETYEGLTGLVARNRERGYPDDRLQEQYARCAKALYQVGPVTTQSGSDRLTGLKFELVAQKNPYSLDEKDSLPVQLFWEGEPMAGVQIRMFRFDGELETATKRTDKDGKAEFPLSGGGKFMLNAVHIFEGDDDPETKLAEWVSYWATLTFGIRGTDELLAGLEGTKP